MARRGFFAELQHQAKVAAREQERARVTQAREAERAHKLAVRERERREKERQKAAAQTARTRADEEKRRAKEAAEAHIAAMESEAESRNAELARVYGDLDSILEATLSVDDYVDLNTLRVVAEHPPFSRPALEQEFPLPEPIADPPRPVFNVPPPLKGLAKIFGKGKAERQLAAETAVHEGEVARWQEAVARNEVAHRSALEQHAEQEARRRAELAQVRELYAAECKVREEQAAEQNAQLDTLIANLGYGVIDAVQEYISIVLSNSVYPDHFPVTHEFEFDAGTAELKLRVGVPGPSAIPTVASYKYKKSSDEIVSSALSQKACKDRYAGTVHQVALRTLHEVLEADRRGIIHTISLEVGTNTISPATGLDTYIPFVAVGAERESFLALNLSNVVPASTLQHLGAAVSKSPFDLVPADVSGIRHS